MLIFAGTESMFPAISEVFSPIPRFFKRIDVGNFVSVEETKECILKPLSEEEKQLVNLGSVTEIHIITGGNPYEVQLISHYMYKRHKEASTPQIALDVGVLDNVLLELERLRERGGHEVADIVRRCYPDQLRALLATLECPSATIEQLSRFMVLSEIESHSLDQLSNQVSYYDAIVEGLIGKVITEDAERRLRFSGGQFDVLYLKYFAFSKGITEFQFGIPDQIDASVETKLTHVLLKELPEYETNVRFDAEILLQGPKGPKAKRVIFGGKFRSKEAKPGEWVTVFSFTPAEMESRFYLGDPSSIRFRANVDWLKTGFVIQATVKDQAHLSAISQKIESLRTKLLVLGIEVLLRDEVQITTEANALKDKGDFKGAHAKYDEATRMNPNSEIAWANKGLAFLQRQDYGNALKCFEKWTEIRPRLPVAWENRGRALIHLGNFGDALESLQKAVDLGPEVWSAWDNRGRALLNTQSYDAAIASFNRALALKPDDRDAGLLKGICYLRLGRHEDALVCFEEFLQYAPHHVEALAEKAIALYELGKLDEAASIIGGLLAADPGNLGLMNLRAMVLSRSGDQEKAISICSEILAMEPEAGFAYFNRACFESRLGKLDESLADLGKAIELDPMFSQKALDEEDFQNLRGDPRFEQLVS